VSHDPAKFVGKVCAFYAKPGMVQRGIPVAGATRHIGAVIAAKPLPPAQPGDIPNFNLTVRGRSGRVAEVSMVDQHANLFDTWHEAGADSKQ
jgi:hypothetical protein